MYKICKTEQSSARQRELENGLLQLMLKRRYEDISVSDLCEYMQVPRKSFYRYFSSKDGALYALIDHTLADFFQMPHDEKKARGTAAGDLALYFTFWCQNSTLLDALRYSSLSGILVERASQFALQEGHLPRHLKNLRPEFKSIAASFSVCGLMSMILNWHAEGFLLDPNEMTQLALTFFSKPILPL